MDANYENVLAAFQMVLNFFQRETKQMKKAYP